MKRDHVVASIFVLLAALGTGAQTGAQKPFDLMKSLSGNWEGKSSIGGSVQVSYRLTSGGVIISEMRSEVQGKSEDMISMIHMDGDRVLLTHYCSAGNQPRMQASMSPDGRTITFAFVDATNLASPADGHMDHVIFTFIDANHHTEEWHYLDHGKEMSERIDLQRKS
jgi:hypothetical protein